MPYYVVERVAWVLNKFRKTLNGAKILILGMAYKKDVDDQRESPSLRIVQLLMGENTKVIYNDPFVPECKGHRHYPDIDMKSVELTEKVLKNVDLVLLLTDHTAYDYAFIKKHAPIILDTRNAFERNGIKNRNIYKA
jgi:UDP-N-acetyl-D-glucosamine dehydrogenase